MNRVIHIAGWSGAAQQLQVSDVLKSCILCQIFVLTVPHWLAVLVLLRRSQSGCELTVMTLNSRSLHQTCPSALLQQASRLRLST